MSITVRDFDRERDLDLAAELLAERHLRDREREPMLPAAFELPQACRPLIEQTLASLGCRGVVAESGGKAAGFMIMTTQLFPATHLLANFFPPRGVSSAYNAHAAREGMVYDAYRAMYAVLADYYVGKGFFDHSANLAAEDEESREAWVSLGFGRTMACAVRGVDPTARAAAAGIEMQQAGGEDAGVIFALNDELAIHHARSPIFNPLMRESDEASHEFQKNLLNDPDTNAHWVAYEDGRAVGMNTFMGPLFLSPMTLPEKTVYLFQGIVTEDVRAGGVGTAILSRAVTWAREKGYQHIALHFASANLQGAKFWQSSGFKPVEHGMRRHVDERIAWANR